MSNHRKSPDVWITGMGAVTPLGGDVQSTWDGMCSGRSGVTALEPEIAKRVPVKVIARAAIDPAAVVGRVFARTHDRNQQLAVAAAREAWIDAGVPEVEPERLAVVVGSGVGGILTVLNQYDVFATQGSRLVSPFTVPMLMPNGSAAAVGLDLGAKGGIHAPVSACASGAEALAMGLDLIRAGRVDVVVCGGSEAAIHPLTLASFASMRALSQRGAPPEGVSRPFNRDRDGFVLGEGAGVLVLESALHAAARRKTPFAALAGAGMTSDAHHVTHPDPQGSGATRAMRLALEDAGAEPADVVHLNAHATSTNLGDLAEAGAVRSALGGDADHVAVSATKSSTGHLLGAAGAVEAIASVLALRDGVAPVTRNLDAQDERVALDVVATPGRRLGSGVALSNSFGFGGHNVVLVFTAA